jgi:hypothetical protein
MKVWQSLGENRALSSTPAEGEMRDLGSLPAGFKVYRPCPIVYLPVKRRRLWESHDSEGVVSGSQSHLVANTCWSIVPGGGSQCFQTPSSSSPSCVWEESVILGVWALVSQMGLAAIAQEMHILWDAFPRSRS